MVNLSRLFTAEYDLHKTRRFSWPSAEWRNFLVSSFSSFSSEKALRFHRIVVFVPEGLTRELFKRKGVR